MKIQIVSDLHLEFMRVKQAKKLFMDKLQSDVDLLIVAGDLAVDQLLENAFNWLFKYYKKIVYVPGNHEYYGSSPEEFERTMSILKEKYGRKLYYLDNKAVTIDGQKFVGSTMWFRDDPTNVFHAHKLSDFLVIDDFVPWVYEENRKATDFLYENVDKGSIVVTHHIPSFESTPTVFKHSELNRFFICDMEPLIEDVQPKLWIHGHTHDSCDYKIEETQILCNPFGYFGNASNKKFNFDLTFVV